MRMYTLEFIASVQSRAHECPVAVGINPHGPHWTQLHNRINSGAGSIIAGDFSNFDGRLPAFVGRLFLKFVNQWHCHNGINDTVRNLLFEHIFSATHIANENIYQVVDGNPSGNPLTSIYNSFCNLIMMYTVLTIDFKLTEDQINWAFYGDDNLLGLAPRNIRASDLAPYIKKRFDMDYTHYSKGYSEVDDTMSTIRFLGRAFVFRDGVYRAPLELDVVRECLYWCKGTNRMEEKLLSSIDSYFIELSHFPEPLFKAHFKALYNHLEQTPDLKHLSPCVRELCRSYYYYHDKMFNYVEPYECYARPCGHNACGFWNDHHRDRLHGLEYRNENEDSYQPAIECESMLAKPNVLGTANTENNEFADRATIDPVPTQEEQIGTLHDATQASNTAVESTIISSPYETANMEVLDLNGSLDRMYQVDILSWPSTAGTGVVLATYQFPKVLFDNSFIADKIKDFRLFRAGIRIAFRVTTNKFLYGTLMVEYQPIPTLDAYPSQTVFAASGSPHIRVSAASSETVIFDVPFISQYRALNLQSYLANEMGQFRVWVVNPVTNVEGAAVDAQVFVTAQFVKASMFLPHGVPVVTIPRPMRKDTDDYCLIGTMECHSKRGKYTQVDEMRNKSSGLVNKASSVQSRAADVANTNYIAPYADTFSMVESALSIGMMLGLSKPTTENLAQIVKTNTYTDTSYGKGVDMSLKLTMDPENGISTQPVVGGQNHDEMDFATIMGTPQMINVIAVLEGTQPFQIASCGPFDNSMCFFDFVVRNVEFSSGSVKIQVNICASSFHSVRLVFWYADDVDTEQTWQDCFHQVVDIQGDTVVQFTVPYGSKMVSNATSSGSPFGVWCKVLTWSVPDPSVSAPIYLNVYKAAASDVILGPFFENSFIPDVPMGTMECHSLDAKPLGVNIREDFAQVFPPIHESVTGYTHDGLLFGEKYDTLREVVHRYQPIGPYGASLNYNTYHVVGVTELKGVQMWGLLYRFRRGSMRFKLIPQNQSIQDFVNMRNGNTSYLGCYMSNQVNPVLEVETPYYSNVLFQSTTQEANTFLTSTSAPKFVLEAMGDDGSFHWLRAMPSGTLQKTTNGYDALRNFVQAGQVTNSVSITGVTPTNGALPVLVKDSVSSNFLALNGHAIPTVISDAATGVTLPITNFAMPTVVKDGTGTNIASVDSSNYLNVRTHV